MTTETDMRDFFAAQAMIHWMRETSDRAAIRSGMEWEEMVAVQAYMMADAMMAVRSDK